ncbi:MAG: hypothetical protein M0Z40_13735 [Actinomycetota bacterium]|nr:hypothetical protein [Actinomycetota bacterium]MDA8076266.1 hypothetical protein [Actinomycetota bacterium]
MTPFMDAVVRCVDEGGPVPEVMRQTSRSWPTATGTQRHAELRLLAEQLVCEANAVLPGDSHISLVDVTSPSALEFELACQDRAVRVTTRFAGSYATTELGEGLFGERGTELCGPEQLEMVLLRLVVSSIQT